jgi:hypothetical protein
MSTPRRTLLAAALGLLLAGTAYSQNEPVIPRHNPFDRPRDVMDLGNATPAEGAAGRAPVLRATLTGGGAPVADIDGQILSVGQVYLGYRLLAIDEGRAVIANADERIVLTVHEGAESDVGIP